MKREGMAMKASPCPFWVRERLLYLCGTVFADSLRRRHDALPP